MILPSVDRAVFLLLGFVVFTFFTYHIGYTLCDSEPKQIGKIPITEVQPWNVYFRSLRREGFEKWKVSTQLQVMSLHLYGYISSQQCHSCQQRIFLKTGLTFLSLCACFYEIIILFIRLNSATGAGRLGSVHGLVIPKTSKRYLRPVLQPRARRCGCKETVQARCYHWHAIGAAFTAKQPRGPRRKQVEMGVADHSQLA